jgi:nucleoside-diphosphate-sugar epimerase
MTSIRWIVMALSKVANEKTARAFAARFISDIYALRIANVIEPHEYGGCSGFAADPPSRKRNATTRSQRISRQQNSLPEGAREYR